MRLWYLIPLLILAGCATIDGQMEEWIGKSEADLVASWGAPAYVHDDGEQRVLVYELARTGKTPTQTVVSGNTAQTYGGIESSYDAVRSFFVEDGVVVDYKWKGL